jgi:hypothetical protein
MADTIRAQFSSGLVDYACCWAVGILYDLITGNEWVLKLHHCVEERGDLYDEDSWRVSAASMGMKFTMKEILALYQDSITE